MVAGNSIAAVKKADGLQVACDSWLYVWYRVKVFYLKAEKKPLINSWNEGFQ